MPSSGRKSKAPITKPSCHRMRKWRFTPQFDLLESRVVPASFLSSVLELDVNNTFEDQSREAYVDVDNDGKFSVGDAIVGFVRIDDKAPIVDGVGPVEDRIYAIFSQQVTEIAPNGSRYSIEFGPTTVPGLTLSDLTGVETPEGGMVAVYDSFSSLVNLINVSPGDLTGNGTVNIFDYFKSIRDNATLQIIAGLGHSTDYLSALTSDSEGANLITEGVGGLAGLSNSVTLGNFAAGMSILVNNDPSINYASTVVSSRLTTHQLVITRGAFSGVGGLTNPGLWDNTDPDIALSNPGGFSNDADFVVHPTRNVIEPKAKIEITPDATNRVGDEHTFTVTVMEDDGLAIGAPGGDAYDGFGPAVGETVTVTLSAMNGAVVMDASSLVGLTDADGQFQVKFTSLSGGQIVGSASSDVSIGGAVISVATDDTDLNSGPATKTFVDAFIIIEKDGTNLVGDPHTFTATYYVDNGDGVDEDGVFGNYDAFEGAQISITLTDSDGADSVPSGPLDGLTDANGQFSVTFTSQTPGTTTGVATATTTIDGVDLTETTDGSETVVGTGVFNSDETVKKWVKPGIHLEKLTNGVDADTEKDAPEIAPGDVVTWTYLVTNTGGMDYTLDDILIVDDAGTPNDPSDDFSTETGDIVFVPDSDDGDGILSPGETWEFTASGIAQDLAGDPVGSLISMDFSGSTALDGMDGNTRTYSAGGVSVRASAFSRSKSTGTWSTAYLGAYSGGLGVTDNSEGSGSGNSHTVDNVGQDNYVLLEFSEIIVVDSLFLGYVVNDSDLTVWIGTVTDVFNNHQTLSDSFLASLGFTEVNMTTSGDPRSADINNNQVSGNVIVIAAWTGDKDPDDKFKIEKVKFYKTDGGCYENYAVVTVPGAQDDDPSHYCNPDEDIDIEKYVKPGSGAKDCWDFDPKNIGVDADEPTGPKVKIGDKITFTYIVTNTGSNALIYVTVVDDNGTPHDTSDDFRPDPIEKYGYNIGDKDKDGRLDPGEKWYYQATRTVKGPSGQQKNIGVVKAKDKYTGEHVTDSDPAYYYVLEAPSTKFYVVDDYKDDTFEYDRYGNDLDRYDLYKYNTSPRGVASNVQGNMVWVIDADKYVYVYDNDGHLKGKWEAKGLCDPQGIATDGTHIWIVDRYYDKVFFYKNGASRLSGYDYADAKFSLYHYNTNPRGITTDGKYLWVVDDGSSADKVYKYKTDGTLIGKWTIDSYNSSPTGITIDPSNVNHIWIVDNRTDKVYQYDGAAHRTSGSQKADWYFKLAYGNCDPQGIADPPPPGLFEKAPSTEVEPLVEWFASEGKTDESQSALLAAMSAENYGSRMRHVAMDAQPNGHRQCTSTYDGIDRTFATDGMEDFSEDLWAMSKDESSIDWIDAVFASLVM